MDGGAVATEFRGGVALGSPGQSRAQPTPPQGTRNGLRRSAFPRRWQVLREPVGSSVADDGDLGRCGRAGRGGAAPDSRLRVLPNVCAADLPEQARGPHGVRALPQSWRARIRTGASGRPGLLEPGRVARELRNHSALRGARLADVEPLPHASARTRAGRGRMPRWRAAPETGCGGRPRGARWSSGRRGAR